MRAGQRLVQQVDPSKSPRVHPVHVEHAVEVIHLVLGDSRLPSLRDEVHRLTVAAVPTDPHLQVPPDQAAVPLHAEAALEESTRFVRHWGDRRVDDNLRRERGALLRDEVVLGDVAHAFLGVLHDEDAVGNANLRRREPDAAIAHDGDHLLYQFLYGGAVDAVQGDLLRHLPQHGGAGLHDLALALGEVYQVAESVLRLLDPRAVGLGLAVGCPDVERDPASAVFGGGGCSPGGAARVGPRGSREGHRVARADRRGHVRRG